MGFESRLKDHYDNDPDILTKATTQDLRDYGMIPEFIGRLPMIFALGKLDREMLVRILKEPKNALVKQYETLFRMDGVELEITDEAVKAVAEKARERKTGARGLRSIMENLMTDIMYEIPSNKKIKKVIITEDTVMNGKGAEMLGSDGSPVK
jgi:ATP-dependent Clp protease ATP-binding subunit ClpX